MNRATSAGDRGAPRPLEWLGIAGVLVLAALLRWHEAVRTPLWYDELFTLDVARRPLGEIFRLLAQDLHPPLFTLLVSGWRALGGDSALALKSLPLLIGFATLLATWGFARRLFGARAAFFAALLLAVHHGHIYFSQELRAYGLLALATTLAAWAAWNWIERPGVATSLAYVAAAALGMYTHYLFLMVLALLAIAGAALAADRPGQVRGWLLLQLGAGVTFLPQFHTFRSQLLLSGHHWLQHPAWPALLEYARHVAFGAKWLLPVVALLTGVALARPATRRPAAFTAGFAAAVVVLPFVLTHYGAHLYVERYMFFVLPLWCAAFAAGASALPGRLAPWAAAVLLAAAGLRGALITPPLPEAVEIHDAAVTLCRWRRPGEPVYCADVHTLFVLERECPETEPRLVTNTWPLPFYMGGPLLREDRRVHLARLDSLATAHGHWWLIRTRTAGQPPDLTDAHADSLARGGSRNFGLVRVWAGERGMLPESPAPATGR